MHHPDQPRGTAQVVRLRPLRPAGPIPAPGETAVIIARARGRVAMAVRHMIATGAVQPTRQPGGAA